MIKSVEAIGVHGRFDFSHSFHPDINILTGKNGAGKTTLLKILWYVLSGNLGSLCREVEFKTIKVVISEFEVVLEKKTTKQDVPLAQTRYEITCKVNGAEAVSLHTYNRNDFRDLEPMQWALHESFSIFFPTFRRIEGGFGIEKFLADGKFEIAWALHQFAANLSRGNHRYILGVSSNDVNQFIEEKRYVVLEQLKDMEEKGNKDALIKINEATSDSAKLVALEEIKKYLSDIEKTREEKFLPYNNIWTLLVKLLGYQSMSFGSYGFKTLADETDVRDGIHTNYLSGGEKQMLSFVTYNGITSNATIIIDEPEISLHPDWQRSLIPTLRQQNPTNQLIMSTHSPFIYTLYEDREIVIDEDKGE